MRDPHHLIELVYDAGLDQTRWFDLCMSLSTLVGHAYVAMHGHDAIAGTSLGFLNTNYDESYLNAYIRYYGALNPWAARVSDFPAGVVQTSEMIVSRDDLVRTEWYNDWVRPQEDIATGAGVTLFKDEHRFFRLSCNIRVKDQEAVQGELVRYLELLTPHIQRSLLVARRLAGIPISASTILALEKVKQAAFLLDIDCRIQHCNAAAERMLDEEVYVRRSSVGSLECLDDKGSIALRLSVSRATMMHMERVPSEHCLRSSDGMSVASASVSPFRMRDDGQPNFLQVVLTRAPVALVLVDLPTKGGRELVDLLTGQYGLTRAEADLAVFVGRGRTLQQLAAFKGVSLHTVRTQLKLVFEKLGVNRQASLVALIGSME